MFSCENSKIFKNTYFEEQLRTTISETCSFSWTAKLFWLNWSLASVFVSQFIVFFTNSPFPIDTAVIRSSLLAILCKVSVLTNFPKFTRKHLCFLMNLQIYRVLINLTKKEISARIFSLEFCEISHNTFLITNLLDGCSCIKACSACYIQRVYSWKFCTLTKNFSEL